MKQGFIDILTKIQKDNPDSYAALKELADNIDYLKGLLEGVSRTTGSKNAPNILRISDQLSVQAPDPFQIAQFGEPNPYCGADVNNHIFGLPAAGAWYQSADIAGLGKYTWDTELYNDPILFTLINGNTEIQCNIRGKYLFLATCYVTADAGGVGQVSIFHVSAAAGAVNVGTDFDAAAGGGGFVMTQFIKILDLLAFDTVYFENTTGIRKGNAGRYTEVAAYRLN